MNKNKFFIVAMAVTLVLSFTLTAVPSWAASKEDEKKQQEIKKEKEDIRKMSREILNQLYKVQPSAKAAIASAAGYATFSNFGMKIFVAGSGTGKGIAIDNKTKKEIFMKVVELQAGLGFGIKKFRLVWVFENQKDLTEFIDSGVTIGGQTSIAAKAGDKGAAFAGAMVVKPGVWVYQLTDKGVALELTAKGTKYYKDSDLN